MPEPGSSLKNIFISAGVAVLVIALVVTCFVLRSLQMTEYETLPSPDARFKIVIYRRPLLLGVMPGQAGDAPGLVRLYDREGKLLHESKIGMVQEGGDIRWEKDEVYLPAQFRWKLPQ
jgi:hypothetical protein